LIRCRNIFNDNFDNPDYFMWHDCQWGGGRSDKSFPGIFLQVHCSSFSRRNLVSLHRPAAQSHDSRSSHGAQLGNDCDKQLEIKKYGTHLVKVDEMILLVFGCWRVLLNDCLAPVGLMAHWPYTRLPPSAFSFLIIFCKSIRFPGRFFFAISQIIS
jgi:hypothetical protein